MIVRCVRIIGTATGRSLSEHPGIRLGVEYPVLEVYASRRGLQYRIYNPEIGPNGFPGHGLWGAEMFEIVSVRIPACWVPVVSLEGKFVLAPSSWLRPNFWDDYFDAVPTATAVFDREVERILADM